MEELLPWSTAPFPLPSSALAGRPGGPVGEEEEEEESLQALIESLLYSSAPLSLSYSGTRLIVVIFVKMSQQC